MRWARANWAILSNTEMILGDPGKGEVYGYAHVGKDAALIVLRNPDLESKTLALSMSDMRLGADEPLAHAAGSLRACEIYPAMRELDWAKPSAEPLNVQVLGSEAKVIAVYADPQILARLKL
jgi:hypothetical protein